MSLMKPAFKPFFFLALLDHDTVEYKDLKLLLAMSERFWDTTCTFHFPSIGEVMLAPYDFSVITSLKLGGERIEVNNSIPLVDIRGLLGVMPPKFRCKNIPLMWLYSNIDKCETIATSTRMLMLLFIGSLLCPDLGSTMSLRYLRSLRNISHIKNYDWGGMAYATPLAFYDTAFSAQSFKPRRCTICLAGEV